MHLTGSLAAATKTQRWTHFLMNALSFSFCYQISNLLALQQNISRNIALPFEKDIPFWEWMIIPYLSSGVFFTWGFFLVKTKNDLLVLSQRILLATVCATIFFIFYPLRFNMSKPEIESPLYATLFTFLSLVDKPYNQLPSLHVAYCLILWQQLQRTLKNFSHRLLLAICLLLVAISTIFTYQHHILDVVGGLLLAQITQSLIQPKKSEPSVALYYAVLASIILLLALAIDHFWFTFYLIYLGISLFFVSIAYMRRDRFFLRKRNGKHSLPIQLIYAPYLFAYWITWLAVQYRERNRNAFTRVSDNLWIGRRLSPGQAKEITNSCTIIDLSPELSETNTLRRHKYFHFLLLDLVQPDPMVVKEILASINNEFAQGKCIYLHCAMGYSRSKLIAGYVISELHSKKSQ